MSDKGFYDSRGVWINPGEPFCDSKGEWRMPGDKFYDSQGVLRNPGDTFSDSKGMLRNSGDLFYNGEDYLNNSKTEKVKESKSTYVEHKYTGETHEEMMERLRKEAEEKIRSGEIPLYSHKEPVKITRSQSKKEYYAYRFNSDLHDSFVAAFKVLLFFGLIVGICYILSSRVCPHIKGFKYIYLSGIISFVLVSIGIIIHDHFRYPDNKYVKLCLIMSIITTGIIEIIGINEFNVQERYLAIFYGLAISMIPSAIIYMIKFIKNFIISPPY